MRVRRLPPYVYVADLVKGRRVLEIGCDDGGGASLLSRNGAASVIAVDRSARAIQEALLQNSRPNLQFRIADYGALPFPDKSFDVVCVPEATDLVGWLGFLEEVRRVVVVGGHAVFTTRSGDRPERRGGITYHEIVDRLEPLFGPVRMVGMAPFSGFSLVEFASEEAEVPELELDTSLHTGAPGADIVEYVAVAGPLVGPARGYLLVQLPVEDQPVDKPAREAAAREAEAAAREGHTRLARAIEERDALETELAGLRRRVIDAENEIGRVHAEAAREVAEARRAPESPARPPPAQGDPAAVPAEPGPDVARRALAGRDRERELESALCEKQELAWRVAELEGRLAALARPPLKKEPREPVEVLLEGARLHAEAMAAHAVETAELRGYVEELTSERDRALAEAQRAEQAARASDAERARLELELRSLRDRAARCEGELLKRGTEPVVGAAAPVVVEAPRVPELEQALEKVTQRWKQAEGKSDELWRKVGEMQRELESNREQAVETARQQRHAAQVALTRAMDEASKKLVSVKDELARTERERKALEKELAEGRAEVERTRQAVAESQRAREEARDELETIRVMSAQGYLEVRQEITRAREQAAEDVHRARAEVEACGAREQAVLARLAELEEALGLLASGLRQEEDRLGELEEGLRRVHAGTHSLSEGP